jgi:hypothetical protein
MATPWACVDARGASDRGHRRTADHHVWDPILESHGRVWYVGGTTRGDCKAFSEELGERLSITAERFDESLGALKKRFAEL